MAYRAAEAEIDSVVRLLLGAVSPIQLILFGSACEGKLTDQSDLDFLVVVETEELIIEAQKSLRSLMPLSRFPVDLVWVTRDRFERMKNVGGVCLIAHEDGRVHYEQTERGSQIQNPGN